MTANSMTQDASPGLHFRVPLVIRGRIIEDGMIRFGGRGGDASFDTPDVKPHLARLAMTNPSDLKDLYAISLDEIIAFLATLGERLSLDRNPYVREAFELSCATSGLSRPILQELYQVSLPASFGRDVLEEIAEQNVGRAHLEGWVRTRLLDGRWVSIRAFGARAVHITAGNLPLTAAATVIRNALTRSDAIVKSPSNDPLTAAALARTMIEVDADHPVTRHFSTAYWRGGTADIEDHLYVPSNLEKIVAWGGLASVKHVTRYLQPGIDLITLDPKHSSTIIGREAFESEPVMREVAARLAADVGALNQEACVNARVVYLQCGTGSAGVERLNRFGAYLYEAMQALPERCSSPSKHMNQDLRGEIEALKLDDQWYRVIGGEGVEGAVIVSQTDQPVDFARLLSGRVANLVPIDDLETAIRATNAYTQTIGVYPDGLRKQIRDRLSLHGAQRLVSLGYATSFTIATPQDAIEPMRRMCRWIVEEECSPQEVAPPWR